MHGPVRYQTIMASSTASSVPLQKRPGNQDEANRQIRRMPARRQKLPIVFSLRTNEIHASGKAPVNRVRPSARPEATTPALGMPPELAER